MILDLIRVYVYDHDIAMFNIPDYQLISQGHSCSTHSGLIIFLDDSYS